MAAKGLATAASAARRGAAVPKIDLFYDVASPYSWLAFETLMRYRNLGVWDADITLRPFFLGGIMKATGNKPPATLKAKGKYMKGDLARMARYHGAPVVPLKDPRAMFETLAAQRLLNAAAVDAPEQLEGLTRELWTRLWGGGRDIASEQGLQEACMGTGMDASSARSLLARSGDADIKARLKEETEEALRRGAFGAPWITLRTCDEDDDDDDNDKKPWEAFFGCDRFDVLAQAMGQPWFGPHPNLSKL
ncbi:unnamed protein product [Ectocarpus fasciculatus]